MSDSWTPEEVPPRNKLLYFICEAIKSGQSKEATLEQIPEYLEKHELPEFADDDIAGMIDWGWRKVRPTIENS